MDQSSKIKFWLFILVISIFITGLTIYFTYKKIAYDKNKVETYIVYNPSYAYYYDNKKWTVLKDTSFIKEDEFIVYNDQKSIGKFSAIVNEYKGKISYSDGEKTYSDLIGINSNQSILLSKYDYENITDQDISFVKNYISSRNQVYFDGSTNIKTIKIDIDGDVVLEDLYMINYNTNNFSYFYLVIKDGSNVETIISYSSNETDISFKRYDLGLIIDADLNEKKEILIIENGYEYSKLLLYANQYGTYSLVE